MAETNVSKWGNSLALRIPKAVADAIGIEDQSKVRLEVEKGALVVKPADDVPEFSDKDLARGLRLLGKQKRAARASTLDFGKAVGRETW